MASTDFASAELTLGQLNALVRKVGGTERVRELLRDDIVVVASTLTTKDGVKKGNLDTLETVLKSPLELLGKPETGKMEWHDALHGRLLELKGYLEKSFPKKPSNMQVWKSIKLGTGLKSRDDFKKAFKDGGFRISDWSNDIMGKPAFTASDTEQEVDLVLVTAKELGLPNGGTRAEIYKKADENGLDLCTPEVGPQLRLQYKDQPKDEWMLIGMEPIVDSTSHLRVFRVVRDYGGLWLRTDYDNPDFVWHADGRWVFLRRK